MKNKMSSCLTEADISQIYKTGILKFFDNCEITSPHMTDGVLICKDSNLKMLLEFKYDKDFTKRDDVVTVLIQCLYYLKKFENAGEPLPNIIFVGDKNELFYLHINTLIKYLKLDLNWKLPASTAVDQNLDLFKQMYNDHRIRPFVHKINKSFKIKKVFENITFTTTQNAITQLKITHTSISYLFNHFVEKVIKKSKKYNANDLVNIFLNTLISPDDNYLHPKKSFLVSTSFGNVPVDALQFKTFFDSFTDEYKPEEKAELISICDRLIEDETRRRKGEFYTPTIWCNEAHRMISDQFGLDWKEKYVVWDSACGTGNLTRDYCFKELYCSTLNQSDIDIMDQANCNPEATKFSFDFLNDPDEKLPEGLKKALFENKPIIFFMNPPYGQPTEFGSNSKSKIANTKIALEMKKKNCGFATRQLYAQFLYKISQWNDNNIKIALFTPPLFLTGTSYEKFRKIFLNEFNYESGILFNAGHFSNVSTNWGISFTLWSNETKKEINNFPIIIKDAENINKTLYNLDKAEALTDWIRIEIRGKKREDEPKLKNALDVVENNGKGRRLLNSIGFMHNNANNVQYNGICVGLYSSTFSAENAGLPVTENNYQKCIAGFTARKTIQSTWINQKDEYMAPNENHPDYQQWNNDCLVYSLFNGSSNQSSLRDITYKDKQWDIQNEWFWMSNEKIKELANEHYNDDIYQDCKKFQKNRFVYKKLQTTKLSDDAQEILELAKELTIKSFDMRKILNDNHPEYHLNTWDAGWYQIKKILKKYYPEDLKNFNVKYKKFNERMAKGVYKFGFLK